MGSRLWPCPFQDLRTYWGNGHPSPYPIFLGGFGFAMFSSFRCSAVTFTNVQYNNINNSFLLVLLQCIFSLLQMYELEMTMGMEFPMGMGIPWDSNGNGNW